MYQKRKEYQLDNLTKGIKLLESKMRFIEYVIDEKIQVYKKSKQSIIDALKSFEFPFYENNCIINYEDKEITSEYNYLLNLSIYNFTLEKVDELKLEIQSKIDELDYIRNTTIKDRWIEELDRYNVPYIFIENNRVLRVRKIDNNCILSLKIGLSQTKRLEFEYEISVFPSSPFAPCVK